MNSNTNSQHTNRIERKLVLINWKHTKETKNVMKIQMGEKTLFDSFKNGIQFVRITWFLYTHTKHL